MGATIRKAVFPAAGLGTRFLPATKAQPKEMLVLVDKPVIRHKLVDMQMRISSTEAWLDRVTELADEGKLESDPQCVAQVCMLKNHATQAMQFCADQAVQILGGMGYMRGTRSERLYREAKVMMIGGGSEEIMKDLAARQWGV